MKVYIAGKITGVENYRELFNYAENKLICDGHIVFNPAAIWPCDLSYDDYMALDFKVIDICDAVYFLKNWRISPGANQEYIYAKHKGKVMFYE